MKPLLIALALFCSCLGFARAQDQDKPAIFPQLGHSFPIVAVAYSPDGRLLASGAADKTIKLWDIASGRELRTLGGMTAAPLTLAFSPDGATLASGGADGTVRLWKVASGASRQISGAQPARVFSIAFSPDGKHLVTGSDDNTTRLWDVVSGKQLGAGGGQDGGDAVAFSRDGTLMATGGVDHTITLRNAANTKVLSGHTDSVAAVAFSPDGKMLASGGLDKTIRIWDTASGQLLRTLTGSAYPVRAVVFMLDGTVIASADYASDPADGDHSVRIWDVATGRALGGLGGHTAPVLAIALSPDGTTLASASWDHTIKLWNMATGGQPRTLTGHARGLETAAVSPDGKVVASGGLDDTIRLWDTASGHQLRELNGHAGFVESVAFSPDGAVLASGSDDKTIKFWDVAGGRELRTLSGHAGVVNHVAFSPDGKVLASASDDHTVRLWDVASGAALRTLVGHTDAVEAVAFSPQGQTLASGGDDKSVRIWNVATGALARTLNGHTDWVSSIAYSPDGAVLASGGFDGAVKLWSVASGQALRSLQRPTGAIDSVAFSPDGKVLAAGGGDNDVTLWEAATGGELRTLTGNTNVVNAVAFSRDGRTLVSAGGDGTVRFWDPASGRERITLVGFMDGSFIAVTPEGFFDSSSEAAEENLNVRIGNRVFGMSSFRENFYRPDLVTQALAGEDIAQYGSIDTVKLSPVVELVDTPASTAEDSLQVKVHLTDGGGGFGPVRVFRNGTIIKQDTDAASSGATLTRGYAVPLFNGPNDIKVSALNADASMSSDATASVTSTLPVKAEAHGTLHALIIGIQEFPNRPDNNLTYPTADAQLVADTLKAKAAPLFEKVDIQVLTGAAATDKAHVVAALKAMQASVGPGDEFVFYVASHGLVADGVYYLATSNLSSADPARLKVDAISSQALSDLLANIPATRKLVIIDTCDAGAAGQTLAASRGLKAKDAVTILGRTFGLTVLAATTSDQEAIEGGYQGHGLFTYVVADGLSGKAADATSGIVSSFLLADYVGDQVPLLAQTVLHRDQQPTPVESGQTFAVTKVR